MVLMDARVLGRVWQGQIMGRDPQVEEWAADAAPDVEALQQLLSTLDEQRAVWPQLRVFRLGESRGPREEGDTSRGPRGATEAQREGYPGPVAGPDPRPGAAGVAAIPGPSVAPLRRGEVDRGITGPGRADGAASRTRAATPGVPPRAAPGKVGPGGGESPLGGPQPGRGEEQPAGGGKGAAALRQGATEAEEEWEKGGPPLGEEPPGKGGARAPREQQRERGCRGGTPRT